MDVVRLLHRSVYVLVYTRPFGAAAFAGMKLLRELGTGKASAVMLSGRARGGLTAFAACGAATDAVMGVGVASPPRRRLARKTSVEEGQLPALGTSSGAVSPAKRRLGRKTSVEEGQLLASGAPLLRAATSLERAAKTQRLIEGTVEEPPDETMMDAIGQPLRLEGVHESAAVRVGG